MTISFDSYHKWIILPNVTSITSQEIYNAAMDWADEQDAMDDDLPMSATGFAPLGGGAYTDKIFILINGWKLKPYSGTYILTIIGTIITDDGTTRIVPPDSGEVQVIFQVVSQGIVSVIVAGSGVTQQDKQDIANLVWLHTTGLNIDERVLLVKKIETNKWIVTNDQLIIYDDDGVTPLKTFNLSGEQKQAYSERAPI